MSEENSNGQNGQPFVMPESDEPFAKLNNKFRPKRFTHLLGAIFSHYLSCLSIFSLNHFLFAWFSKICAMPPRPR
jgi:hypothetical protein